MKVEVVQLFPLSWSPELELKERRVVPDRTGQVWVISDFGPHLILEPAIHIVGPGIMTDAWVHPALSLITGEQRSLGEWLDEPWLTRDDGAWKRIT